MHQVEGLKETENKNKTCIIIIIIIIKEKLQNYRLCCPGWPQNKTERTWKEGQVLRPC